MNGVLECTLAMCTGAHSPLFAPQELQASGCGRVYHLLDRTVGKLALVLLAGFASGWHLQQALEATEKEECYEQQKH